MHSAKLIIGLGNPGRDYTNNRHNIGFICVNYFAKGHGIRFDKRHSHARSGSGEVASNKVVVAKPQTYMNLSGKSVYQLIRKFNISFDDILIVYDDITLSLGKIRIRQNGSSGGHRGIESIISWLGSKNFPRLRIGIGQPASLEEGHTRVNKANVIDYVLSDFTPSEQQTINKIILRVSDAIHCLLTQGLIATMNKYN